MVHHKLVRDKIPQMIEADGQVAVVRVLDEKEYEDALNKKLLEEAAEFAADPSAEEAADVLEILGACLAMQGISREQVEAVRLQKREERGGFDKRIYLMEVREKVDG
ncbi:MAG: phosphoribosyl-ATP pyrophosphohydrolase [Patescibacteria group bacterium]|jgi:predicted house-cleaning noncanonical NTP pyrophosphatase (MazG superfamily)|nr:phosphoribosyl-ATP pyrophosphohydrolase [Patescibacteria group bacterium]